MLKGAATHTAAKLPWLRRLPIIKIIAIAEIALVARRHYSHLDAKERKRLLELMRRPRNLSDKDKKELRKLVAKLEPRAFIGSSLDRISPLPLPKKLTGAKY